MADGPRAPGSKRRGHSKLCVECWSASHRAAGWDLWRDLPRARREPECRDPAGKAPRVGARWGLSRVSGTRPKDPFAAPMPCSTSRSSAILPPRSRKASASPAQMSVRSRHPEAKALCFARGSTGLCFAWAIRSRVLGMGDEAGRCFVCRCRGSLHRISGQQVPLPSPGAGRSSLHLPVQRVVASPAGAEGRCFACRCSGSLLRMPGQRESRCGGEVVYCTASRCGARHRARMSTSFSGMSGRLL